MYDIQEERVYMYHLFNLCYYNVVYNNIIIIIMTSLSYCIRLKRLKMYCIISDHQLELLLLKSL